jgi:methylmalonyl-CoA mutase
MAERVLPLAEGFPTVNDEDWRATLGDDARRLVFETLDGLAVKAIAGRGDWPRDDDAGGAPGAFPFRRGGSAEPHPWDIRQILWHPDPAKLNAAVLKDLERGVTSVTLRLDEAARRGLAPGDAAAKGLVGACGAALHTQADFTRALEGVHLDMATVGLEAGVAFEPAARMIMALWETRGVSRGKAMAAFNADPLGALVAHGVLPDSVEAMTGRMAALAAEAAKDCPHVTTVAVDTRPWHAAGASEAQELAAMLAAGVAYLRALTDAGLTIAEANRQIVFILTVDADFFTAIAKLRAARTLWAQVMTASGADDAEARMTQQAVTADRMMSRRDPWVNLLRGTAACFAGAVAGADIISVAPFTAGLGVPDAVARRLARNTQIVLAEESHLARVLDPAGGANAIELLTDQLAEAAWARFQKIEADGGMAKAILSGAQAAEIAKTHEKRLTRIATRRDALTGVSEFPDPDEKPVAVEKIDMDAIAAARREGETLGTMLQAQGGTPITTKPLPFHTLHEPFERLRDAADAAKERPRVFLANMGRLADYTARATFAVNLLAAGGVETVDEGGFDDAAACAKAFGKSGAAIACLCGTDDQYADHAAGYADALRKVGAKLVMLAGKPGEKTKDAADLFIHMRCDALAALEQVHGAAGVKP